MVVAKRAVRCNTRKQGTFGFYCRGFMDLGNCFGCYIVISVFEVAFFELSLLFNWQNQCKPVGVCLRKTLSEKYLNYLLTCFSGKTTSEKYLNSMLECFSEKYLQKSIWTICRCVSQKTLFRKVFELSVVMFLGKTISEKYLNYLLVCFSDKHFQKSNWTICWCFSAK